MSSTVTSPQNTPVTGLIEHYREGRSSAGAALLTRFGPYIQKWERLLLYGKWDHKDKEIRHFLTMMGSVDIEKTALIISLRLKAYEREDIEQEIRVIFLEVALRTPSIRHYFRYSLQKRMVNLLRDPLVYNYDQHVQIDESLIPHPDATAIDDLWVAGYTCGPGFDELTPKERKIIQLHHHRGLTIGLTAETLGIGTATVSRTISRVKKTLSTYFTKG